MLADNIKKFRISLNLSQVKAAEICDLPRTTYRDMESSRVDNPTMYQICKLCKGFKATPNDLIPKKYWN